MLTIVSMEQLEITVLSPGLHNIPGPKPGDLAQDGAREICQRMEWSQTIDHDRTDQSADVACIGNAYQGENSCSCMHARSMSLGIWAGVLWCGTDRGARRG